jgi:glycerol-3-phosphate acyltransferase PlsY
VIIIATVAAYFFGGIPIGLLIGRARGIDDIRQYGSGNIGASNVLRVIGVKAGLFVWFMDALKGFLPVFVARSVAGLDGWALAAVAVASILGHCFSPYLRLTGGRGVSTTLGVLISLDWRAGVICFALWLLVVAVTRYISLASMMGASIAPLLLYLFSGPAAFIAATGAIALIVLIRHIPNIQRLLAGTERKIGRKEASAPESETAT